MKAEHMLREKDSSMEYQKKEAAWRDAAAQAGARLQELEKTLRSQQEDADLRLRQKETQWLSRIQSLEAELSSAAGRLGELKKAQAEAVARQEEISANAKRYEEKMLAEFSHEKNRLESEIEQKHRQETGRLAGELEKKHRQEIEKLAVELEQKRRQETEHVAGELEKKHRQEIEKLAIELEQKRKQESERVTGELEQKHRQEIERLAAERDAFTASLSGELQNLRGSMRTDLVSFGEQYTNEIRQMEAALSEKERALAGMAGQVQEIGAHSRKQVEDMRQHAELLAKDNEILSARCAELEKEIVARQQRETEQLRGAVARMEDIKCDDSSVIEFPQAQSGDNNGTFGRFWKNLHSPVVEIDFKNRKSHGGKY